MLERNKYISEFVTRQLACVVPDGYDCGPAILEHVGEAIKRVEDCIFLARMAGCKKYDYLVSWQHAMLIYFLANTIWRNCKRKDEAVRLFILNKALNGLDLYFEVEMGEHFLIGHTVGTVFAKATYGKYCVFHQGCTIGRQDDKRPILGDGTVMFPGSRIIGDCVVNENTVLSAGVNLINYSTPGNCIVFEGKGSRPIVKEIDEYYADRYFSRNKAEQK